MPFRDYVPEGDPEYARLAAAQKRGNGFRDYIPAEELAAVDEPKPRANEQHDDPDIACESCGRKFRGRQGLVTHLRLTSCGGTKPHEEEKADEEKAPSAEEAGDSGAPAENKDVTATDAGQGEG